MITIEQWRAAIGWYAHKAGRPKKNNEGESGSGSLSLAVRIVLFLMLVGFGCVESNPGPVNGAVGVTVSIHCLLIPVCRHHIAPSVACLSVCRDQPTPQQRSGRGKYPLNFLYLKNYGSDFKKNTLGQC